MTLESSVIAQKLPWGSLFSSPRCIHCIGFSVCQHLCSKCKDLCHLAHSRTSDRAHRTKTPGHTVAERQREQHMLAQWVCSLSMGLHHPHHPDFCKVPNATSGRRMDSIGRCCTGFAAWLHLCTEYMHLHQLAHNHNTCRTVTS